MRGINYDEGTPAMETTKENRDVLVTNLRARDGDLCQYPSCNRTLDFTIKDESRLSVTVDHWMPKWWCLEQGWTVEQIWEEGNLKLMHKECNAKKGELVPNSDGTLPERETREFRLRRHKRANRPVVCPVCNSGRSLGPEEECPSCGSGPMPHTFPQWAKVKVNECTHEGVWWCWACSIGIIERTPAMVYVLDGEFLDE